MIGLLTIIASMQLVSAKPVPAFHLSSADLTPNKPMPKAQEFQGFGCDGGNLSPALTWTGAPAATKSFALTVYDPDAPTGSGWWHWIVINIPASISNLPNGAGDPSKNSLPAGAQQTTTDFGSKGFGGACPPKGDKPHRYIFTIYALKTEKIDVPEGASGALVGYNIKGNMLASASFMATYQRK
jgi:Raf kinase inhibitor-like YbhB/YbcL family protein